MFDNEGVFRTVEYIPQPQPRDFIQRSRFCHAGCMIYKSVLQEVGGYDETDKCKRVEDYDLWVRIYHKGYRGYNIQEPLYSMRDDRNATGRRTLKNRLNERRVKKKAIKFFGGSLKDRIQTIIPIIKWLTPGFVYKLAHRKK